MPEPSIAYRMAAYTAWANDVTLRDTEQLDPEALTAPRDTLFGDIRGTFDHILVVAEIFEAHLEGLTHPHRERRRAEPPPFSDVADRLRAMDGRMVARAAAWDAADLAETVTFEFVGGGAGAMTREDILLYLANHATYHRGFISTLLYPLRRPGGAANDLTVFLRDVWPGMATD